MKLRLSAAVFIAALTLIPTVAPADNPAPHLHDHTEMLFDPADEARIAIVLKQEEVPYRRDKELPGTPIFEISLLPSQVNERVLTAVERLPFLRNVCAWAPREKLSPQQVKRLAKLRQIEWLQLQASDLGKDEMQAIGSMPRLRFLFLGDSVSSDGLKAFASTASLRSLSLDHVHGFTDSALSALSQMKSLETLYLAQTCVTDAALKNLATLPKLRHLDIDGTGITDTGLESLAQCTSLILLSLNRTKITDNGIKALSPLFNLQRLHLQGCDQITAEGVRSLQGSLPDCRIRKLVPD